MTPIPLPPEMLDAGAVLLHRISEADAEELAAAVQRSLEHLRPWMRWATADAGDVESQRQRIASSQQLWAEGDHRYVMRADGAVVGGCGLHRRVGPGGIEIGYWVHVDHTGLGFATAAAKALTAAAFDLPDISRVEIHCDRANLRSQVIPIRVGYRLDRIDDCEPVAPAEIGRRMIWVLDRPTPQPSP